MLALLVLHFFQNNNTAITQSNRVFTRKSRSSGIGSTWPPSVIDGNRIKVGNNEMIWRNSCSKIQTRALGDMARSVNRIQIIDLCYVNDIGSRNNINTRKFL